MTAVTTELTVFNKHHIHGILSDDATRIKIVDEGSGFFLELCQMDSALRLEFSEWEEIVDAVRFIKAQYEMQGLL